MKKSLLAYSGINLGSCGINSGTNSGSSGINSSTCSSSSRVNSSFNSCSSFFNFGFSTTAGGEERAHSQDNQNFFHSLSFFELV